jgi:Ca2+-binding EF-hand superfamily protein
MTSRYAISMSVPPGFPDLLKDFTREVLREVSEGRCKADEEAILAFAAQYFSDLSLQAGTQLTPEMLRQMAEKLFIAADQNGNGRLDLEEIKQIIASLASDLQLNRPGDIEYVTAQVVEAADVDGDGFVDYEEFLPVAMEIVQAIYESVQQKQSEELAQIEQLASQLFDASDVNGSGSLSPGETRSVFEELLYGVGMSDAEKQQALDEIMGAIDENNDGLVQYNEFIPVAMTIIQALLVQTKEGDPFMVSQESKDQAESLLAGMGKEELEACLIEVFNGADTDGSGVLEVGEFRQCLLEADLGLTDDAIETLMAQVDTNQDGSVDFSEFAPLAYDLLVEILSRDIQTKADQESALRDQARDILVHGMSREELQATLDAIFTNADKDGSGELDQEEFKACLADAELGFTAEEIEHLMASIDSDENSKISHAEFLPLCYDLLVELVSRELGEAQANAAAAAASDEAAAEDMLLNGMPKEELEAALHEVFAEQDTDGNGYLTIDEFKACLSHGRLGFTDDQVQGVLANVDADNDGRVTYTEFIPIAFDMLLKTVVAAMRADAEASADARAKAEEILVKGLTQEELQAQLNEIFQAADTDGSGRLDAAEFKTALEDAELGFTEKEIEYMMNSVDGSHDGYITFAEFAPLAFDLMVEHLSEEIKKAEAAQAEEEKERAAEAARDAAEDLLVHGMTKEELEACLMDVFKRADTDGSGSLDMDEMRTCLADADLNLAAEEIEFLVQQVDEDGDGDVTFDEFAPLCFDLLVEVMSKQMAAAAAAEGK